MLAGIVKVTLYWIRSCGGCGCEVILLSFPTFVRGDDKVSDRERGRNDDSVKVESELGDQETRSRRDHCCFEECEILRRRKVAMRGMGSGREGSNVRGMSLPETQGAGRGGNEKK